ncbi:MAG: hypothetical protein IJU40_07670 [Desulfovibrionaceae bacterium]|nr:hypothetical protein [Desulfovibrionaceae bacterium]
MLYYVGHRVYLDYPQAHFQPSYPRNLIPVDNRFPRDPHLHTFKSFAIARNIQVSSGGRLVVEPGGSVLAPKVSSGGIINVYGGGRTSNLSLASGGRAYLYGGHLKGITQAYGATLNILDYHVKIDSLRTNSNSQIVYNLTRLPANFSRVMLTLGSNHSQIKGNFSIRVTKRQDVGTYLLSKNLTSSNNSYTLNLNASKLGVLKTNNSLTSHGVKYSLANSGQTLKLKIATQAGEMLKGTNKADNLTGSENSDIFYGGRGNDRIQGQDGRDVAIYDRNNWGKDVIAKTSGTFTILFKDLRPRDIQVEFRSNQAIIHQRRDYRQTITVEGWNPATHNIVYGHHLNTLNQFISAATPSQTVTNKARNEVWKAARLA